jgi:molybdopterin/thiamine biosynthesis adenylyltransferase
MKFSKKIKEEIIKELWENAVFNEESLQLVTDAAETTFKKDASSELELDYEKILPHLATIRNRHLISSLDQKKLQNTTVAIFGMSVGSNAAVTWMMESRANTIKIADPDTVSPSNLNRIRFDWESVGEYKVDMVSQEIMKMNPFCKVISETKTGEKIVTNLLSDSPKVELAVDAMDDFKSKLFLRREAKRLKIPVIMVTDIGDNVMLDIERYDTDQNVEPFGGRWKGWKDVNFDTMTMEERRNLVMEIVGLEHHSEQMIESLLSIGKSVSTWPQLGATSAIAGGVTATTIKKIILGEKVKSGRYYISLDELLVSDWNSKERINKRKELANKFK